MRNEYGGCIPKERFLCRSERGWPILDGSVGLNSGRAAIYGALLDSGCKTIYLPYYTCPSIRQFLMQRGIWVKEYHLRPDFLPEVASVGPGEMLLWTNYYGCMEPAVIQQAVARYGPHLILDQSQALFAPPVPGVYVVYVLRKFLGVSGGALLYHSEFSGRTPQFLSELPTLSYDNAYLTLAAEQGSNAAYALYSENEQRLELEFGRMDGAVRAAVARMDLERIQNQRRENFLTLHRYLGQNHPLALDFSGQSPMVYPLYTSKAGLRPWLLSQHIFVSTWWRRVLTLEDTPPFERDLVQNLYPIPLDQRYDRKDMEELGQLIQKEITRP